MNKIFYWIVEVLVYLVYLRNKFYYTNVIGLRFIHPEFITCFISVSSLLHIKFKTHYEDVEIVII